MEKLNKIHQYILSQGYTYDIDTIRNIIQSFCERQIILLFGIPGSGKTTLAKTYAEAMGATTRNSRFLLIPVKHSWTNSKALIGHYNTSNEFIPGQLTNIISRASKDKNNSYFVCFDEINLADMNQYLKGFLDCLGTRKVVNNQMVTDDLFDFCDPSIAQNKPFTLSIPENIYFFGTINNDEASYPIPENILNEVNVLELTDIKLIPDTDEVVIGDNF